MTDDLTDFLLARIAEEKQLALDSLAAGLERTGERAEWMELQYDHTVMSISPARVLAECDAKRQMVEQHDDVHDCPSVDWEANDMGGPGWIGCDVLRLLALSHADHKDYQKTWRP